MIEYNDSMLLERITMKDFEQGLKKTRSVIIPFGSVEEHGCHLPLGTDTIHAYELANVVSKMRPVFVAPPVWYGLCRSTSEHPGTLTLTQPTLRILAMELIKSLYSQGLENFILLSGHAGTTHMAALVDASDTVTKELPGVSIAVLSIIDLVNRLEKGLVETKNDAHAGEVETSLMLYLRPDDVKGTSPEEYPDFPSFIITKRKLDFWPGGVWGDPSKANVNKGEQILIQEASLLIDLLNKLEGFNPSLEKESS